MTTSPAPCPPPYPPTWSRTEAGQCQPDPAASATELPHTGAEPALFMLAALLLISGRLLTFIAKAPGKITHSTNTPSPLH